MPTPSPTPGPKPVHVTFDLWNPGGDPGAIERAAQAWRALAAGLRTAQHDLDQQVHGLGAGWTGEASDRFQQWGTQLSQHLSTSAGDCDRIAGQLEQAAAKIRSTNDQIHELIVALGVTALVGIGLTVFTLGFSDAAAAGAATAAAAQAGALVTILTSFLESLLGRWVIAFTINLVAIGAEKAWINPNHDPFHGWTPGDWAHALYGADALVVAQPVSEAFPGFKDWREANPIRGAAIVSGAAGGVAALGSDMSAWQFDGRPPSLGWLRDVGVSAGVSATVSGLAEMGAKWTVRPPAATAWPPRVGLWRSSKQLRRAVFKLQLKGGSNTALNGFASGRSSSHPFSRPPVVTAPGRAPAPPPQVVGGGTYRVRPGDSLWTIAQRTYGNADLWPVIYRANMKVGGDPNLIQNGDLLHLPVVARRVA